MSEFLIVLHLLLVIALITRFNVFQLAGMTKSVAVLFFVIKCFAGFALYYFYLRHYGGGDAAFYFEDAGKLYRAFMDNPGDVIHFITGSSYRPAVIPSFSLWESSGFTPFYNDSRTVILINTLFQFFSHNNAAVHIIWMNFIAYGGVCLIFRALAAHQMQSHVNLLPFLLPQSLTWTSCILKEPLLIFQLGLLVYVMSNNRLSPAVRVICLITVYSAFYFLKPVVGLLLLPAIAGYWFCIAKKPSRPWIAFAFTGIFFVLLAVIPSSGDFKSLPEVLYGQQLNMYRFAVYNHAGSLLQPLAFAPSAWSFIRHIPGALLYTLILPLPWQYKEWWAWVLFAENIFTICMLFIFVKSSCKKIFSHPLRLFFLMGGLTILIIFAFLTPVAGSLVRYRIPGILFLLLAFSPGSEETSSLNERI